jgi:hypothetical protein
VRNRGIARARMFMGALLLLAAMFTWGIGLTMSPHGETVARGTEYLRTTIVTFKRNGALGTLILCAIAAWLLFPRRRPRSPRRDWSLIMLLAFLIGSSFYTLIWLPPFAPNTVDIDENLAITDISIDRNASVAAPAMEAANINPAPPPDLNRPEVRGPASVTEPNDGLRPDSQAQFEADVTEEQADVEANVGSYGGRAEPTNNETDENEERERGRH